MKKGNLAEAGGAADDEVVLLGEMPARMLGSPSLSWMTCSTGALADDGLGDAGDGDRCRSARDLDLHLEGDLVVVVDGGGHVDVDADVEVGELGLHADAGDAGGDAGVVGAGGDGDLLADLERGALAVGGADAGVLQDAGVGVGEQRVERAAGDADGEVGGVEVGERVEREVGGRRWWCRWWCVVLLESWMRWGWPAA